MLSAALGSGKKYAAAHLATVESCHHRQTRFMADTQTTYLPRTSAASVFHQRAFLFPTSEHRAPLSPVRFRKMYFLYFRDCYKCIQWNTITFILCFDPLQAPPDKTPHNIIFLFDDPLSPISAAHMGMNMGPSVKRNDSPPPWTLYCHKLLSKGWSLESSIICARSLAALVLCRWPHLLQVSKHDSDTGEDSFPQHSPHPLTLMFFSVPLYGISWALMSWLTFTAWPVLHPSADLCPLQKKFLWQKLRVVPFCWHWEPGRVLCSKSPLISFISLGISVLFGVCFSKFSTILCVCVCVYSQVSGSVLSGQSLWPVLNQELLECRHLGSSFSLAKQIKMKVLSISGDR